MRSLQWSIFLSVEFTLKPFLKSVIVAQEPRVTSKRPLVVTEGNGRSEGTEVGGGNLNLPHTHTGFILGVVGCLFCLLKDTRRLRKNMESESKRKMKERFGLRRDVFKEFLAEFLGIFVLIVSNSLCTCHPD